MKLLNNNKLVLLIIIVLLISNALSITALVVKVSRNNKEAVLPANGATRCIKTPHYKRKCMFADMNLSKEQDSLFHKFKHEYVLEVDTIKKVLHAKRNELIKELHNEIVDSSRLILITQDIGALHTDLKIKTIDFYLKMKGNSTREQQEELYRIFKELNRDHYRKHHSSKDKKETQDKSN